MIFFEPFDRACHSSSKRVICNIPKDNMLYPQEVGILRLKSPKKTTRTNLNSYLLVYVKSGYGTLIYEDSVYSLKENDMFFIDCRKKHTYMSEGTNLWELAWIHFYGAFAPHYYESFCSHSKNVFSCNIGHQFCETVEKLMEINSKPSVSSEFSSTMLVCDILTHIMTSVMSAESDYSIEKIMEYIDAHFTEKLTLDDLCSKFFISRYYLSRQIRLYLGIKFSDYLMDKRIAYSKELLRFTDSSVEEIARTAGIPNTSFFIAKFKYYEGVTPLSYRKKWIG